MSTPEPPFCFPIKRLENSRLTLEPFDLSTHADLFVEGSKNHPELFAYVPHGPFPTTPDFKTWYDSNIASKATITMFAILTKPTSPDSQPAFAGVVSMQDASVINASIEIGILTLPPFHRTFVTSNAIGLLLLYVLDQPPEGLGLRRCVWQCNAANQASRRTAERMRFAFEGVQRFERVVQKGKVGNGVEVKGTLGESRDSANFAHYCDWWAQERGRVLGVMERR